MAEFFIWMYILCNFFVYLLIAVCLLCAFLPRRRLFALRLAGSAVVGVAVTYGYSVWTGGVFAAPEGAGLFLGCVKYILCFFLACLCVWFSFCIPFRKAVYYGVMGYAIQHIGYSLFLIADAAALELSGKALQEGLLTYFLGEFSIMAVTYLVVFCFFRKYIVRMTEELQWKALLFPLALMMLAAAVLSTFCSTYTGVVRILLSLYALLLCAAILFMLYKVYEVCRLMVERQVLRALNAKQKEQFEVSKRNIEYINVKCHDLRTQLDLLRGGAVSDEKLKELRDNIIIYDSSMHTGNRTLDVILSEKGLYCEREGIRFTCIADGAKLDFMDTMDLCAIFCNLLDNAIEAVMKISDADRRLISVKVSAVGNMVHICVYNSYEQPVSKQGDGSFATTKADRRDHGFGLRSARMAAERNGGEMKISADGQVFCVDILVADRGQAS